ncbi:hypothetical protein AB0K12_37265 [Nonomuraea sp. NPDC049419]|uniref:MmyB family transcriptional regulator n=1 Tax=Nonomuraea sp. NPDC049419 TaxID=3155772 RepID=UPI003440E95B
MPSTKPSDSWNRAAHALLAGHLPYQAPDRPHVARLVFLDPHTRELYADWRAKARDTVAELRMTAARCRRTRASAWRSSPPSPAHPTRRP